LRDANPESARCRPGHPPVPGVPAEVVRSWMDQAAMTDVALIDAPARAVYDTGTNDDVLCPM
jgi:hypothetical protein